MKQYVNFNDESLPIGKRKQAYVKWATAKGTTLDNAKRQANKKFGFEKKAGILAIVRDYGRMDQRSFEGSSEIFWGYDLRKYETWRWIEIENYTEEQLSRQIYNAKLKGWDVIYPELQG